MDNHLLNQKLINDWYDTYGRTIFKYVLNMINDYQEAEDLMHDVFIKAFTYLEKGKVIDYPKTFLYKTAHNLTIDFIRKQAPIKVIKDFLFRKKAHSSLRSRISYW
ncbi:RNA polymerase sigma factor (sigma-70 family) [Natronobacillus azotifigens]|uniref:RNA polymerase sigma factor n=1 Tax=Natronobacillus azotifigens TaxID=472978 RepID=A0A9J6RE46_9BACI|nr:RNA polymerase sigma factor [Natronobacillus azotifigens]